MISPPAPHAPYTAAQRHSQTFEDVKALRTPNFNIPSGLLGKNELHFLFCGAENFNKGSFINPVTLLKVYER